VVVLLDEGCLLGLVTGAALGLGERGMEVEGWLLGLVTGATLVVGVGEGLFGLDTGGVLGFFVSFGLEGIEDWVFGCNTDEVVGLGVSTGLIGTGGWVFGSIGAPGGSVGEATSIALGLIVAALPAPGLGAGPNDAAFGLFAAEAELSGLGFGVLDGEYLGLGDSSFSVSRDQSWDKYGQLFVQGIGLAKRKQSWVTMVSKNRHTTKAYLETDHKVPSFLLCPNFCKGWQRRLDTCL